MFALSAIATTAAQAKAGPFYKIGGIRLAAGEKEEISATAQKPFILSATGVTITCQKIKVKAGAEIIGSSGTNSSTSKETIEFEECVLKGNGIRCRLPIADKGVITTESVKNTLDYPKKTPAKGDSKLVLFQPQAGSVFVKINVEAENPKGCTIEGGLAVEGSVAAEAQNEKKEPFKLLEKITETVIGLVHFPVKGTEDCTEKEGEVTCIKPKLTLATKTAKLEGAAGLTLKSKKVWGVFSE
jgi:hypothetical protein